MLNDGESHLHKSNICVRLSPQSNNEPSYHTGQIPGPEKRGIERRPLRYAENTGAFPFRSRVFALGWGVGFFCFLRFADLEG